jgi:hypothetical protein
LPQSPSPEDVDAYETLGERGPAFPDIRLDWGASLKSVWNDAAITFLAEDLRSEIKKDKIVEYDNDTMNLGALKKLCAKKLVETRRAIRTQKKLKNLTPNEVPMAEQSLRDITARRRKADRYGTRRHSVSFRSLS